MKTAKSLIFGILAMVFLFGLNPIPDCLAKEEVITLKLNNPWPPTHHGAVRVYDPWAKFVNEKTNGRVQIRNFHGGSLSKARDVWEGTLGGMWDIAVWIPTYKYDSFIGSLIAELPFVFPDHVTAIKIMRPFIDKWTKDEFKDIKIASFSCTDLYALWTKKKITKIEDFKGLKLRVAGRGWQHVLAAWGATPVSLSPGDMYMGLERGTVDGLVYSITGGAGMRLQEVSPYVIQLNAQCILVNIVMNKNSWNKLPKDIQTIFDNVLFPELDRLGVNTYSIGVKEVWDELEKEGKTVYPSEQMKSDLRKSAQPVWDEWIKKATEKGYPAAEMVADLKQRLKAAGVKID